MATISFTLRKSNSKKPLSIYFNVNLDATQKIRGSLNIKIESRFWDFKKQKVKRKVETSHFGDKINLKLKQFKLFVEEKIVEYKFYELSKIKLLLKNDIDVYLGKIDIKKEVILTFYQVFDKFIKQAEKRNITQCTRNEYKRTLKMLKEFEKTEKYEISFKNIDLDFYYALKDYLEDLDYAVNTIGKYIKNIKTFLNYSTDEGYNNNYSYKNKRFQVITEPSEQIYLNENELKKIINLDLSNQPILNNARNLFIIGAYTGLRVSDFNVLTKENIHIYKGQRVFKVTVKKTGQYLPIPIHPVIEDILEKYNGNTPKKMKHQDINDCLSEIGMKAKINQLITTNITKGGKLKTKMTPKYKLIKNHTARRSFCTNAYKSGMEVTDIMTISGHKSFKTFRNYIKITQDDRAVKIAQSDFFKTNMKIVN